MVLLRHSLSAIPRQTPSPSASRTTTQSLYPMPPAAHESAPYFQRCGRTAAGGGGGNAGHNRDPSGPRREVLGPGLSCRVSRPLPPITRNQPTIRTLCCNCTIQAGYSQRRPHISGNPGLETGFPENSREKRPKQAGREGPGPGNRRPLRARNGCFGRERGMRSFMMEKRDQGGRRRGEVLR
jgi:hypothetical protein